MGLADIRAMREKTVEARLAETVLPQLDATLDGLAEAAAAELAAPGIDSVRVQVLRKGHLTYEGTATAQIVDFGALAAMDAAFEDAYRSRTGVPRASTAVDVRDAAGR